jgi:hypothetical protein
MSMSHKLASAERETMLLGVIALLFVGVTGVANANTDASIQNDTFFGIGGPPSGYAYNNGSPGIWNIFACVTCTTTTYEYIYTGQPFTVSLLPGATNVSVSFFSSSLLTPSTDYGVSSLPFQSMTISDGINTISVGGGTFLSSSFLETASSGNQSLDHR